MKIVMVGTGYVGLVTACCFAEMGNSVIGVDLDESRITQLRQGKSPIYEPGLESLLCAGQQAGRLSFGTDLAVALPDADVVFIAVGTPPLEDGSADVRHVLTVARQLGQYLEHPLVVVDKSTVPVGTADQVSACIAQGLKERGLDFVVDVVSNPEFLKEGAAVDDFMRPDRIIVGTDAAETKALMTELYRPFMRNHDKLIFMRRRDAEMTKYAANALLATKISFINEIALLAEAMDVDVEQVRLGIGADQRIGYHFIYPGCGYGGSCFPKDVQALIHMGRTLNMEPLLLEAVEERNRRQKQRLLTKIHEYLGPDLSGRVIGLWGLAFKPGTDDLREAPSSVLIRQLLQANATILAHDPVAMLASQAEFAEASRCGQIQYVDDPYQAVAGADALVLVTEWKIYRQPDFQRIRQHMRTPVLIDGRNQYRPDQVRQAGILYSGIGRTKG